MDGPPTNTWCSDCGLICTEGVRMSHFDWPGMACVRLGGRRVLPYLDLPWHKPRPMPAYRGVLIPPQWAN